MKKKKLTALLIFCVLAALSMLLSGCEELEPPPSSTVTSEAEPTLTPTEEPASKPESSAVASQYPEPTEAPVNTAGFEDVFAANPIDAWMTDALDDASSTSAILKTYDTAGKYWKAMVPIAYSAAMDVVAEDDRVQLEQDQKTWEETVDGIIETIREENTEDKLTASRLIQERYRFTAEALCEIYFAGTGELPDFSKAMSDEPVG